MIGIQDGQDSDVALIHHRHGLANTGAWRDGHDFVHHHIADLWRDVGHEARSGHTKGLEHEVGPLVAIATAGGDGVFQAGPSLEFSVPNG